MGSTLPVAIVSRYASGSVIAPRSHILSANSRLPAECRRDAGPISVSIVSMCASVLLNAFASPAIDLPQMAAICSSLANVR